MKDLQTPEQVILHSTFCILHFLTMDYHEAVYQKRLACLFHRSEDALYGVVQSNRQHDAVVGANGLGGEPDNDLVPRQCQNAKEMQEEGTFRSPGLEFALRNASVGCSEERIGTKQGYSGGRRPAFGSAVGETKVMDGAPGLHGGLKKAGMESADLAARPDNRFGS